MRAGADCPTYADYATPLSSQEDTLIAMLRRYARVRDVVSASDAIRALQKDALSRAARERPAARKSCVCYALLRARCYVE